MLDERVRVMEADLMRIKGVHSARIRAEEGEITEIHVVAESFDAFARLAGLAPSSSGREGP